jgi:hypothetical protein
VGRLCQDNKQKDFNGINNVAITYFNWDELRIKARGDPAGIIILTYGLSPSYNVSSSQYMIKKLNINHIPVFLFRKNYLIVTKDNKVKINVKTEDAQSYFTYDKFLFARVSARQKALYLRALAMRALDDGRDFVPRVLFNNIAYNPFLKITEDKIKFIYESPQGES